MVFASALVISGTSEQQHATDPRSAFVSQVHIGVGVAQSGRARSSLAGSVFSERQAIDELAERGCHGVT
jgi:hypothetical protein